MHTLSCHDLESLSAGPIGESSVVLFQPPEAWLCSRDWPSQDLETRDINKEMAKSDFSLLHYSILHGFEFPFSCIRMLVARAPSCTSPPLPSLLYLGKYAALAGFNRMLFRPRGGEKPHSASQIKRAHFCDLKCWQRDLCSLFMTKKPVTLNY